MIRAKDHGVILRDWEPGDLEIFREWLDPRHEWHRMDAPYDAPLTTEEIDGMVARCAGWIQAPPSPFASRLVIALVDGTLIGTVSRYGDCQLGIGLYDRAHWGKGYGTVAMQLWIDLLKSGYPEWQEVKLSTWTGNPGMVKIARKLGFEETCRSVGAYVQNGFAFDRVEFTKSL